MICTIVFRFFPRIFLSAWLSKLFCLEFLEI